MNDNILDFLEAYKSLDELCKQILSSDKGVSEYIEKMDNERQGDMVIACWNRDYKQLKKMRWIRNRLVHETNSFEENLVNIEDIKWLQTFHDRIIECTDPFSLLHQSRNTKRKTTAQEKISEKYSQTNKPSRNLYLVGGVIILTGIILIGIIIFFIAIVRFLNF